MVLHRACSDCASSLIGEVDKSINNVPADLMQVINNPAFYGSGASMMHGHINPPYVLAMWLCLKSMSDIQ